MARVALCDVCGAVIRSAVIKQVEFILNSTLRAVCDVCDECYDELEKCMKAKEEEGDDQS